jgi:hypothetical protein
LSFKPQVCCPLIWVQALPATHSGGFAPSVHDLKQSFAVGSHLNVPQENATAGEHLPLPSHIGANVPAFMPAGQLCAPQVFVAGCSRHAPAPLQNPSLPQPAASGMQRPSGSTTPFATALHAPVAHVMHVPAHAVAQQTLSPLPTSTQLLCTHSAFAEHFAPSFFFPQLLMLQVFGGAHAPLSAHDE